MGTPWIRFCGAVGLFLTISLLHGGLVELEDGRSYEGTVREKKGVVTVVTEDALFQFDRDQVKTLETGDAAETAASASGTTAKNEKKQEPEGDDVTATSGDYQHPLVKLKTSKGDMTVELYEDKVPNTVANMIQLAEKGFYQDLQFHRIIPGFMAQGGCPYSKEGVPGMPGTGGPGYKFADEIDPSLKHDKAGVLSMANSGPNTNGSQFFLCFKPAPHLDGRHAVFGQVIDGMDVLEKLEKAGTRSGKPTEDITFDIEVIRKNDHPYEVETL